VSVSKRKGGCVRAKEIEKSRAVLEKNQNLL